MDQAAGPVPAQHLGICTQSRWMPSRRGLLQRPVRPVEAVMAGVLLQDQSQVRFAGDQRRVQALAAGAGDPAFRDRVRRGARAGVVMIWIRAAASTPSNAAVNAASRSRIKNFKPSAWPPGFIIRLRACWVTHCPAG